LAATPTGSIGGPADNRAISSRALTRASWSLWFSWERYSFLACNCANHAFFRWRHLSAAADCVLEVFEYAITRNQVWNIPCLLRSRKFLRFSSSVSGFFCIPFFPFICAGGSEGDTEDSSSSSSSSSSSTEIESPRFSFPLGIGRTRLGGADLG
jgi:hypothetical protein